MVCVIFKIDFFWVFLYVYLLVVFVISLENLLWLINVVIMMFFIISNSDRIGEVFGEIVYIVIVN